MTTRDQLAAEITSNSLALMRWWGDLSEPVSPDDAIYNAFYGSAAATTAPEQHDAAAPLTEDDYARLFPPNRR